MSRLATDNLLDLIRKKHQLLMQLREIGRRQASLVETGNPQPLLQLLAAKQHLINGLQLVERHLRPFQAEDPESRHWRSAEDRQRCALMADECRTLLAEVVAMERDQEQRMREHRNAVASRLQSAGKSQHAADAYRQHHNDLRPAPSPGAASDSTAGALHLDPSAQVR